MTIRRERAEFVLGAVSLTQIPTGLPQIAFAGRSNVGKSSLLNALLGRKKLVKTSGTPGKTKELNFFSVDGQLMLVDLPGFGYAKFSKELRSKISALIEGYVRLTDDLVGVVYLIDLRTAGTALDEEMIASLASLGKPMLLVGTKGDKLKRSERDSALVAIQKKWGLETVPPWVSSEKRIGIDELWNGLEEWISE